MDDEPLDLSAWAAPPAPSNLGDRVAARVHATDEAIGVAKQHRRTRRVFWLAGALVAILAGVALAFVIVLTGSPPPASPDDGALVAIAPQRLVLSGAVANLDPGTEVSWQQSDGAIHILQRSGAATWRVDAPHLFIGVGAAVASIEATNATLRVETRMNLADTRLIGAIAVTSAAVAVVTVVVYEGQAKVSGAGQTVVVQPGIPYDITPGHAPTQHLDDVDRAVDRVVELTSGDLTPHAAATKPELVIRLGEKVTVHDPRGSVQVAIDKQCPTDTTLMSPTGKPGPTGVGDYRYSYTCNGIDKHGELHVVQDTGVGVITSPPAISVLGGTIRVTGTPVPARAQVTIDGKVVETQNNKPWSVDLTPSSPGFLAVRIDGGLDDVHYYVRRGVEKNEVVMTLPAPPAPPAPREPPPSALTPAQIDEVMHVVEPMLTKCIGKAEPAQTVSFEIAPNGTASNVSSSLKDRKARACIQEIVTNVRFPSNAHATVATYKITPPCNADDLMNLGTAAIARGAHAEALKSYDAALECKFDIHSLQLAFMAACRAPDVNAARKYWKRMNPDMKSHLLQMCLHSHITQEQLDE